MSGIVGIVFRDGRPVERADLERMVSILAHRGPDGAAIWQEGAVGLGHRLLWTTPESLHERLPLVSRDGGLVLTADARIDNRDELLPLLGLSNTPNEPVTDSEIILAAYERWGQDCPARLIGDFAFAIWDRRNQTLFCARDHFGVKPFYYHLTDRLFVFASEIKGVLCLPEVPRRLNEERIADILARSLEDQVATCYRDVVCLPSAHSLQVTARDTQTRRYWSLDLSREVRFGSDEEYVEAFRETFTEAVNCRLRSVYPIGSCLSGGLDSSSIVCVARKLLKEQGRPRLHTFSAVFPSLPERYKRAWDEREYMQAVIAGGDVEPHEVYADQVGPLTDLDRVLWHLDELPLGFNLYVHWAMFRAAQEQGVRVQFDGVDGDTVVSHGYEYFQELARLGKWGTLVKEARAFARRHQRQPGRVIWKYGFRPLAPESVVRAWRWLRGRPNTSSWFSDIIHPDLARRTRLAERQRALAGTPDRVATARQQHGEGVVSGLFPGVFQMADKVSSAFGLESRYPFFDRRVVELCVALPASWKLRDGWTRFVLREAMLGLLPEQVQQRLTKADLGVNYRLKLLEWHRDLVEQVVYDTPASIVEYVNVAALRSAYERYLSWPAGAEADSSSVFLAVTLALWLQRVGLA